MLCRCGNKHCAKTIYNSILFYNKLKYLRKVYFY